MISYFKYGKKDVFKQIFTTTTHKVTSYFFKLD